MAKPDTKRSERRKGERRAFPDYMRLMNETTGELVGHLVDISPAGFRLESLRPIRPNMDYPIRIELPADVLGKPFMVFIARSKWSLPDRIDPALYDAGFEIVDMNPNDSQVFQRMFEKYGSTGGVTSSKGDYLWGR